MVFSHLLVWSLLMRLGQHTGGEREFSWLCWSEATCWTQVVYIEFGCLYPFTQDPLQPRSSSCARLKGIDSWSCSSGGVRECFLMRRQLVPYLLTWTGMICLPFLWDWFGIAPQAIAPEGVYHLYSLSSNYSLRWSTINWKVAILRSVLVSICFSFICVGLIWQHAPQG